LPPVGYLWHLWQGGLRHASTPPQQPPDSGSSLGPGSAARARAPVASGPWPSRKAGRSWSGGRSQKPRRYRNYLFLTRRHRFWTTQSHAHTRRAKCSTLRPCFVDADLRLQSRAPPESRRQASSSSLPAGHLSVVGGELDGMPRWPGISSAPAVLRGADWLGTMAFAVRYASGRFRCAEFCFWNLSALTKTHTNINMLVRVLAAPSPCQR